MEAIQRHSGIEVVGDVPWGTHFCQFYDTSQDLIEILVPYYQEGLKGNEFCIWVTSEPLQIDQQKLPCKQQFQISISILRKAKLILLITANGTLDLGSSQLKRFFKAG